MELTVIHATRNCSSSSCPTIYKDEAGNFVIQGFKLKADDKQELPIPEGEDVVMIPAQFLNDFIAEQK